MANPPTVIGQSAVTVSLITLERIEIEPPSDLSNEGHFVITLGEGVTNTIVVFTGNAYFSNAPTVAVDIAKGDPTWKVRDITGNIARFDTDSNNNGRLLVNGTGFTEIVMEYQGFQDDLVIEVKQ